MQPTPTPHILAVAYGGGHIAMLLPVLRALRAQQPAVRITLLALTTARRAAADAGETPLGYADLLNLLDAAERQHALGLGRALLPGNTHPGVSEAETVAYLGVNAWDLQQQLGGDAAAALLADKGRQGFYPLHFFRRVLDRLRPDLVLATNSPRSEQAALDAAAEAGIPTLALLDLFALPGDAFAARRRHPSRVCVLSDAVRDNLIRAGWPAAAIAVTGNPAFDALHSADVAAAGRRLRAALAAPPQHLLLLALQPEPREHPASPGVHGDPALPQRILQHTIACVQRHADWRLLVRPHPSQPMPALPASTQVIAAPSTEPLHPLLHAVDVVITGTSTVGLEAHLAGARVLQLLDSIAAAAMPYRALGVADAACHLSALEPTLTALLAQPRRDAAAAPAGDAAQRVAAQALALLAAQAEDTTP
jgi:hypothetical protein